MYSILLVEDERLELETLRDYVDWEKVGINKVYTAQGGQSALACISENEPDIIITDIQMPGLSGTELAQLIREEGRACKIVFLTGYDKFEYAKTAIQVQAEEYLLKPFQVDEVESLVIKIIDRIKSEEFARETEQLALEQIIEQNCTNQITASDHALWKKAEGMSFRLLGFYGTTTEQQQEIHSKPETIHSFLMESLYMALISPSVPVYDMVKLLLDKWNQDIRIVGIKHPVAFSDLRNQCRRLLSYQELIFFGERQMFILAEDTPILLSRDSANVSPPDNTVLLRAILDGDEELAIGKLNEVFTYLQSTGKVTCQRRAYNLYIYLCERIQESSTTGGSNGLGTSILHSSTFSVLKSVMTEYVQSCCRFYHKGSDYQLTNLVKHYIEEHYIGPCSVEEIAASANRSPNYLRKKFKATTGQTILEYLTEVRLNHAAKLLKISPLKIKEVSVRVGYENISYFTHLFSKKFGVTPNEYKKMV